MTKDIIFSESLPSWIVKSVSLFSAKEPLYFKVLVHAILKILKAFKRHSMWRHALKRHTKLCGRARGLVAPSATSVSLTCDAWSFWICKGYMADTVYLIDSSFDMQSSLLDFVCLKPFNTGKATCNVLPKTIKDWEGAKMLPTVTIDKGADTAKGIVKQRPKLYAYDSLKQCRPRGSFHVWCTLHLLNLWMKHFM